MASSSGAISKDTPTKEFKRLTLTPRAKSNNCGVCDKSLAEDSNKRRLFQPGFGPGTEKTEAALNLQYLLNEELNFEYTLNYICRSCNGKVATAVKSVKKIKEDYYKTKERIKNIYSKQPVVKRLARSTDEDVPKCRKHLFTPGNIETGDRGPPSSMSIPTINTKGTTCGSGNSVQETNDVITFHQCGVCDEIFKQYDLFEKHNKIHVKGEKIDGIVGYCHVTEEKSDDVDEYCNVKEEKTDDIETVYQCNLCDEEFKSDTDLEKHCEIHVKEEDSVLQDEKKLEKSFSECNETEIQNPTNCAVGSKSFRNISVLKEYIGINTGEKPYKCDVHVCNKSFPRKYYLQKHMRTHTGEKLCKCDVCGKSVADSCSLRRHMLVHTGVKRYKCDVCSKSFALHCTLHIHKRIHTGEKPYQCDVCSKAFIVSGALQSHMRIHTGEKPYKCDDCSKSFTSISGLLQHTRTHTGRHYQCDVCSKSFRRKSTLWNHMRIHTSEKPYKCSVCSKSYFTESELQTHTRTHSREKPYKCDVCSKSFAWKYNLQNHMTLHTQRNMQSSGPMTIHNGEKLFKCDVCGKSYFAECNLQTHLRIHTRDKLYLL